MQDLIKREQGKSQDKKREGAKEGYKEPLKDKAIRVAATPVLWLICKLFARKGGSWNP